MPRPSVRSAPKRRARTRGAYARVRIDPKGDGAVCPLEFHVSSSLGDAFFKTRSREHVLGLLRTVFTCYCGCSVWLPPTQTALVPCGLENPGTPASRSQWLRRQSRGALRDSAAEALHRLTGRIRQRACGASPCRCRRARSRSSSHGETHGWRDSASSSSSFSTQGEGQGRSCTVAAKAKSKAGRAAPSPSR